MQKRHKIDTSKLGSVEFLKERIQKFVSILSTNMDSNTTPLNRIRLSLILLQILNGEKQNTWRNDVKNHIVLGLSDLDRNYSNVLVEIDGKECRLNKWPKPIVDSDFRLFNLLNLGILIDDKLLIKKILEQLGEKGSSPYWYESSNFLKCILSKEHENIEKSYLAILDYTRKGVTSYIGLDETKLITSNSASEHYKILRTPIITLYKFAFEQKIEEFNSTLEEFLGLRRKYIGKYKKLDDFNFWVDLNALACCKFAIENGIEITYKSEYIPIDQSLS